MIFNCIQNQTVEFKVSNYQFPEDSTPNDYDSNWLLVYLKVKSNLGHWETVDASLLTWELLDLIEWFKKN